MTFCSKTVILMVFPTRSENESLMPLLQELVECLKDLEHICPTPEDYRQLCALLTLPKLSDHADFKNWNPSSARVECFHKVRVSVTV